MRIRNLIPILFFSFYIVGCISTKKLTYMQDLSSKEQLPKTGELVPYNIEEYRLQINDIIDITMKTTSAELNEMLRSNNAENKIANINGLNSGDVFFLNGYSLDDDGLVDLPLVGEINMVGMNVKEAKQAIENRMERYINKDNYYVRVRLGGIRYGALGEFNRPGKYTILQNRVTIFEAIANAGDMTTLAKRSEVVLVRQYPEGSRAYTINLLDKDINSSEYFFVRPNDLLYAEPLKKKSWGTGITFAQTLQLLLALATVVLLYLNVTN